MKARSAVFILVTTIALGGIVSAKAGTPIPLDKRAAVMSLPGMCSTQPANRWDGGLVTGNGVMGATVLGQPYQERIVFNHERLSDRSWMSVHCRP
ncbi:hypothetical protein Poly51_13120 [Rubripirellula tenax]|uniref:Glycosyl hydrolase family 95 N-terminal domain-containing protein n=1 Tax=Rubripirellula tenax TaxID=2528015 RepID=A0A5C6F9W2_9BACT|nr:glycoside hydrolase N-terminal domain-containing protein [Rubripirellula tenax]TWU58533.1 hypothetical protein Poly51_13120 [Rubripirellula tenax]